LPVQFEDINTYDGRTAYAVVNESVPTWRRVLDAMPNVDTAASVCSGGEISFFAVAPKVRKSLTLIDHAYQSLYYACGKFHLIERDGSKAAYEALVKNDRKVLKSCFEEANKGLPMAPPEQPKEFKAYLEANAAWNDAYREWNDEYSKKNPRPPFSQGYNAETAWYHEFDKAWREWDLAHPRPVPPPGYSSSGVFQDTFDSRWSTSERVYQDIDPKWVAEFRRKRTKVVFCHGDLTDLYDKGPFDFAYFSNALNFKGRNGRPAVDVRKVVSPGGFVAFTGYVDYGGRGAKNFGLEKAEEIVSINPAREKDYKSPGYGMAWVYSLYRLPT
jgi:hypothetical protein